MDKEPRLAGPWLIGFLLECMVEVPFPVLELSISSQILDDCFLRPSDLKGLGASSRSSDYF